MVYLPAGLVLTFICCPPIATYTVPFSSSSPSCASFTLISLSSFRRFAREAVKPFGICCTRSTGASKSAGSLGMTSCNALGPPVELAMATTLVPGVFAWNFFAKSTIFVVVFSISFIWLSVSKTGIALFATISSVRRKLVLNSTTRQSIALSGLCTKSRAPSSSARIVVSAPSMVSVLAIMILAGILNFRSSSRSCRPFIFGMFTSRTTASY